MSEHPAVQTSDPRRDPSAPGLRRPSVRRADAMSELSVPYAPGRYTTPESKHLIIRDRENTGRERE